MMDILNTWWWAFLIVAALFSFVANYTTIVDWWNRLGANKNAQPKLALSVDSFTRQQNRVSDRHYLPYFVRQDEVLSFAQQQDMSYDYQLVWDYVIHITNQTEYPSYNIRVIGSEDQNLEMVVDPKVEYTKPIIGNAYKEHRFIFRMNQRYKAEEAEAYRSGYPVPKIRIEYSNLANVRFATEFFFTEKDDDKKNVYLKVKAAQK